MPRLLGLTGPVGAGKSTVLAWIAAQGADTLDADAAVHDILAGDSDTVGAIVDRFGDGVAGLSGIDRERLGSIVFGDPTALQDLERIVHPAVGRYINRWVRDSGARWAAVEGIKLVEAGMAAACDAVWLVNCDTTIRRHRLQSRGWSASTIDDRMRSSPPLGPQLAAATHVIDNSGTWNATELQLERAWASVFATKEESR